MANLPRKAAICLVLAVLTIAAFWQLKNNDFINYDDPTYVTENFHIQGGLSPSSIHWAFSSSYADNWHPVTWLSHMLDWQLYGLNPRGHHLNSLLLHLANSLLLFLVLLRLTKGLWPSALVAALFALHPLHVESVAWASERKDVLSTFFWLTTMWAYIWYVGRPGVRRYLVLILSFALGLMTKPMLVTEPFVLLLLDYWPLGRWPQRPTAREGVRKGKPASGLGLGRTIFDLAWEKAPLFALAAISCLITLKVQQLALSSITVLPLGTRLANALVAYISYLAKIFWPLNLSVFYPYPMAGHPWWQIGGAGLLLAGLTFATLHWARRFPYLLLGWFWYLGTLLPVIGVVQVGAQSMADRYTYIPLIGMFIILAFGAADLAAGHRRRQVALTASFGLVLLACLIFTWRQVGYWRNSATLFDHALAVTENNYIAYCQLGLFYYEADRNDEAMEMFRQSIHFNPKFDGAYNNLGLAYDKEGRSDEAIEMFRQAIRLNPNFSDAYNNLAIDLADRGQIDVAIPLFQKAIHLRPDFDKPYHNLGLAYMKQGKVREAREMFETALKKNPHNAGARVMLDQLRDRY
jgi:tetratricopeptide (TPR) repeat protein